MPLKQSNNYAAILATILISIILGGGAGLFIIALILDGDWGDLFSSLAFLFSAGFALVLCLFVGAIFAYVYFSALIWRQRTLSAIAQGESHRLVKASDQPNVDLALQLGETLTLERRRTIGYFLVYGSTLLFFAVAIVICAEVVVFTLIPAFGHSTLNPFYFSVFNAAPPPPPSLLDWLAAAYPLIVGFLLIILLPLFIPDQRHTLIADDQGITFCKPLVRRRFIPWNDISLFIQTGNSRSQNVTAAYLLWGQEHKVGFGIVRLLSAPDAAKKKGKSPIERLDTYRFKGGFDHYAANAQRLLATIVARGHAPLQAFAGQPPIVSRINRRFPDTLNLDTLASAPLASKELQPAVQEAVPAETVISDIILKERLPLGPVMLESVVWFIGGSVLLSERAVRPSPSGVGIQGAGLGVVSGLPFPFPCVRKR